MLSCQMTRAENERTKCTFISLSAAAIPLYSYTLFFIFAVQIGEHMSYSPPNGT